MVLKDALHLCVWGGVYAKASKSNNFIKRLKGVRHKIKTVKTEQTSIHTGSAWKCSGKKVGFQCSFESWEGGGVSDTSGKVVPEDGGGHGEGPVAPGFSVCLVGFKKAGLTGSEGACWSVCLEEVTEVGGCQVV